MNKQLTIKVEGFVTVTVKGDVDIKNIPMKIDVLDFQDCEDSPVLEVVETDITERSI